MLCGWQLWTDDMATLAFLTKACLQMHVPNSRWNAWIFQLAGQPAVSIPAFPPLPPTAPPAPPQPLPERTTPFTSRAPPPRHQQLRQPGQSPQPAPPRPPLPLEPPSSSRPRRPERSTRPAPLPRHVEPPPLRPRPRLSRRPALWWRFRPQPCRRQLFDCQQNAAGTVEVVSDITRDVSGGASSFLAAEVMRAGEYERVYNTMNLWRSVAGAAAVTTSGGRGGCYTYPCIICRIGWPVRREKQGGGGRHRQ